MLPGDSTPKNANGGVSTVEPGMGILKANIRGCDWNVNAIPWERLHASAEYIPEGMMGPNADQVPAHIKQPNTQSEQYLKKQI
jgi:hypothetical protein